MYKFTYTVFIFLHLSKTVNNIQSYYSFSANLFGHMNIQTLILLILNINYKPIDIR